MIFNKNHYFLISFVFISCSTHAGEAGQFESFYPISEYKEKIAIADKVKVPVPQSATPEQPPLNESVDPLAARKENLTKLLLEKGYFNKSIK